MTDTPANPYRYYPPKLARLSAPTDVEILELWAVRRDTYDIAMQLGVPEHQVERQLHRVLEARR